MKTVYLVRHGESEMNARMHAVCKPDSEAALTERGKEQSHFIAKRAGSLPIEAIVSSPYVRARDTAALISSETGHRVEFSDLFVEKIVPTSMEGRVFDAPDTQEFYRRWTDTFFSEDARVEDGENFGDMKQRGLKALGYLGSRPEGGLLVVTHGFFMRMLCALVMHGESLTPAVFRGFVGGTRTDNTGITMLTFGLTPHHDIDAGIDRWRIRVFNDHAHLG